LRTYFLISTETDEDETKATAREVHVFFYNSAKRDVFLQCSE